MCFQFSAAPVLWYNLIRLHNFQIALSILTICALLQSPHLQYNGCNTASWCNHIFQGCALSKWGARLGERVLNSSSLPPSLTVSYRVTAGNPVLGNKCSMMWNISTVPLLWDIFKYIECTLCLFMSLIIHQSKSEAVHPPWRWRRSSRIWCFNGLSAG